MSITGTIILGKILEKISDKVVEKFTGEPVAEFLAGKLTANYRTRKLNEQHFMNHDIARALCRSYYKALLIITNELKSSLQSSRDEYRDPNLPGMLEDQVERLKRCLKEIETSPDPSFPIHTLDGIGALIKPDADLLASIEVEKVLTELPSHLTIDSMEYREAVRDRGFDYVTRFFAGEIKDNQQIANKLHAEYIVDTRVTLKRLVDTCDSLYPKLDSIREIAVGIQGDLKDGVALLDEKLSDIKFMLADRDRHESHLGGSWRQINDDLLDVPSSELIQAYYEGRPVQWNLVHHGYTAERTLTQEIIADLNQSYFQAALVTGPGGEGKTTIMYQVALALREQGYMIYEFNKVWNEASNNRGHNVSFQFDPELPSVFLIDDASEITNFGVVFKYFINCKVPIKLIMTARKNEWLSASNSSAIKLSNEYMRYMREYKIKKLARNEALGIAELLVQNGAIAGQESVAEVSDGLYHDTNGFLLAGMLKSTQGKDLETIIRTVMDKIKRFENGDNLINALVVVTLIETIGARKRKALACTTQLFSKILGVEERDISKYKKALSGEVFFETLKNTISTRHERISTIMYEILLESSDNYEVDAGYIHKRLLYAAGDISIAQPNSFESSLLSLLPEYIYETEGYEAAIDYYEVALRQNPLRLKSWTDYIKIQLENKVIGDIDTPGSAVGLCHEACYRYFKHNEGLWYRWADIERNRNNRGDQNTPYTATWIAKEGATLNPNSGLLWCLWAELEKMSENEGDIHTPNSARWILYTYLSSGNHSQNVYKLWFHMERESGNIGSVEQLYSARWIANQMTSHFPSNQECWIIWCELEAKLDNIGSIEIPNSARSIAMKGAVLNPESGHLWTLWAQYERMNGNEGTVDQENSARWILKTFCDAGFHDQNVYGYWLRMERESGNIGSVEESFTARWVAYQLTSYCPQYAKGWSTWSQFEQEQQNIGSVHQPYSAVWLLKEGIDHNRKNGELWIEWGKLEWARGATGDVDSPYTARWIFAQATKELPKYLALWEEWASLELSLGDPGHFDIPYTPRWIAEQGTRIMPYSHSGWILRAQIEIDQGNYGSIEESNSARWLFHQGAKKNGYNTIASPWAKLEYTIGNYGDLYTTYTGRWILWRAIQEDQGNYINWLRFLSLEYANGNIGSVEQQASALWVFDQWLKSYPPIAAHTFDFEEGFEKVKTLFFAQKA